MRALLEMLRDIDALIWWGVSVGSKVEKESALLHTNYSIDDALIWYLVYIIRSTRG